MKKLFFFTLLMILAFFLFAACGKNSSLVGKWKQESSTAGLFAGSDGDIIEFLENGTVISESLSRIWEPTWETKWKLSEHDNLVIFIVYDGEEYTWAEYEYKIEGSKLTITEVISAAMGGPAVYKKIK